MPDSTHDPKALVPRSRRADDDPNLSRRGALFRMFEVGLGIAGAAVLTSGSSEPVAEAKKPPPAIEPQQPLVSLAIETPDGGSFPTFAHGGDLWIAGVEGQRYNLRIQNNSPNRVEVVVSVDGRDVVSGRLGDYVKQRGYVLDPFASLRIEGYRQSLDNVATFRFADLADSYTARLGTPMLAGVIGVAAFTERGREIRRKNPLAPLEGDPFPGEDAAARPAPSSVVTGAERARTREAKRSGDGALGGARDEGWAAPDDAPGQLGTEYGESKFSPVEEVSFKRKHRKKPDQLLVVRYDSMDGLQARGVIFDRPHHHPEPVRTWDEPVRRRRDDFAPPPPPRDWWR